MQRLRVFVERAVLVLVGEQQHDGYENEDAEHDEIEDEAFGAEIDGEEVQDGEDEPNPPATQDVAENGIIMDAC